MKWKKKYDLSQWIRRRGRMCNHEAAMKAAAAFINWKLFFFVNYLSVLALSPATETETERQRERETAEGLSSVFERSNWLHHATHGDWGETETTDHLETWAAVVAFNRSIRRLLSASVTSLLAYRTSFTRRQRLQTQDVVEIRCYHPAFQVWHALEDMQTVKIKLTTACQIWTKLSVARRSR